MRRSNEETSLRYWLATTAVTFSGTRTIRRGRRPTFAAEAAVAVRADLAAPAFTLTVHDGIFHDTRTSLTFSDDGRLTSSGLDSSGTGLALLGSVVTTVAAVAGGVVKRPLVAEDEADVAGPPDLVDRYRDAEQTLLQAVAATATALPAARTADAVKAAEAKLSALRSALDEVRRELAALEPRAVLPPGRKVKYSFVLDVEDLPTEADLLDPDKRRSPDLAWAKVVRQLGIMATMEDPPVVGNAGRTLEDAVRDPDPTKIWFRRPRRAQMTVWGRINDGRLMRRQLVPVDVLDRRSQHDSLVMKERGWFNSTSVAVTLGPLGTPSQITADAESNAGALAKALGGLPADVSGAVSAGATVAGALTPATAADARIAALTAQKQQLQLQKDINDLRRATTRN